MQTTILAGLAAAALMLYVIRRRKRLGQAEE